MWMDKTEQDKGRTKQGKRQDTVGQDQGKDRTGEDRAKQTWTG